MTHDEIFNAYLEDSCPICGSYKSDDDFKSSVMNGGKCMSLTFECDECFSEYIVGFNRSRQPIESEILVDNS